MTPTPSDAQPVALDETQAFLLAEALECDADDMPVSAAHYRRAADAIAALDAERQKREAAERELAALRLAIKEKGGTEHAPTQDAYELACRAIDKHRTRAEAALAKANATIERLTTEGLYISEQFSGAAGDIVKLRARIAELEAALVAIRDGIAPDSIVAARPEIGFSGFPGFKAIARAALTDIEKERDDD